MTEEETSEEEETAEEQGNTKQYTPSPFVQEVLDWTLDQIKSVPYEVPSRWAFYRAEQQFGLGGKKSYKRFLAWTSRARKRLYGGWTPTTLLDDTRKIAPRGFGYSTPDDWINSLLSERCVLSKQAEQSNIILVLFEAEAMKRQFDYYLQPLYVSSVPFKGDTSIRAKWEIAKHLAELKNAYPDKPVIMLYYGDLDSKGLDIPRSALKDIYPWFIQQLDTNLQAKHGPLQLVRGALDEGEEVWANSDKSFTFYRVGLSKTQVKKLRPKIAENPEKPGTYQWEALNDKQAGMLIKDAVAKYWDEKINSKIVDKATEATERVQKRLEEVVRELME